MAGKKYCVFGYDKDADVYEEICSSPYLARARQLASSLVLSGADLCRHDTGEPFDWLVTANSEDPLDQDQIFSKDHPYGFQPPR